MDAVRTRGKYSTTVCLACKRGRRKCTGESPCASCSRKGDPCVYDVPRWSVSWGGGILQVREAAQSIELLKAEEQRLRSAIARLQHSASPPIPSLPVPLRPLTPDEHAILRSYFESTNRLLPVVHEPSFYAALKAAEEGASASAAVAVAMAVAGVEGERPDLAVDSAVSESLGLAVCTFTLLCVGCKLEGRHGAAIKYFELARAGVAPALRFPSRHLVSALLLMTILTRAICADDDQPLIHIALAQCVAKSVPDVPPVVLLSAAMLGHALARRTRAVWPPVQAPVGMPSDARFADTLGFCLAQLMSDFEGVAPGNEPIFLAVLEESVALHTAHAFIPDFPVAAVALCAKALLLHRSGDILTSLDLATAALTGIFGDSFARRCYPCAYAVSRLIAIACDSVRPANSAILPALTVKTTALGSAAYALVIDSQVKFENCPCYREYLVHRSAREELSIGDSTANRVGHAVAKGGHEAVIGPAGRGASPSDSAPSSRTAHATWDVSELLQAARTDPVLLEPADAPATATLMQARAAALVIDREGSVPSGSHGAFATAFSRALAAADSEGAAAPQGPRAIDTLLSAVAGGPDSRGRSDEHAASVSPGPPHAPYPGYVFKFSTAMAPRPTRTQADAGLVIPADTRAPSSPADPASELSPPPLAAMTHSNVQLGDGAPPEDDSSDDLLGGLVGAAFGDLRSDLSRDLAFDVEGPEQPRAESANLGARRTGTAPSAAIPTSDEGLGGPGGIAAALAATLATFPFDDYVLSL